MPELPEVESVRRGLEKHTRLSTFTQVKALHPRAVSPQTIAPLESLVGLTVKRVRRRGKFLWFQFKDEDSVLIAHLGMSGQFRVFRKEDEAQHQHRRATFSLRKREREFRLDFLDQRTFGWLRVDRAVEGGIPESIRHIALDPFESDFEDHEVIKRIQSRRSEIKRVILDQGTLSGVGNIYADEALWRARIHPETRADELSEKEVRRLLAAIRHVMERALESGGTSFDQLYVNVNGESGYFTNKLMVYGRGGESCRRCRSVIKRIHFTNRSSHLCPQCQQIRKSLN